MTNKQKERGKYFETKTANCIRNCFGLKEYECRRAPNSGNGEFEFGDIFFTDPVKYPLVIECKWGYDWDFTTLFPETNKLVLNFLEKVYIARNKYINKFATAPYATGVVMAKPHWPCIFVTTSFYDGLAIIKPKTDFVFENVSMPIYIYSFENVLSLWKKVLLNE